jgi:hypothetical protein
MLLIFMGDKINTNIIKDIGILMGLCTLCIGLWYTAINLQMINLGGNTGIGLRLIGVSIITILSFLPYYILHKAINETRYKSIWLGMSIAFLIGDIILKLNIIFDFMIIFDFIGVVSYLVFFSVLFLGIWILDKNIEIYKFKIKLQNIFDSQSIKKYILTIFNKKKI